MIAFQADPAHDKIIDMLVGLSGGPSGGPSGGLSGELSGGHSGGPSGGLSGGLSRGPRGEATREDAISPQNSTARQISSASGDRAKRLSSSST